jgi:hypothetical protein
MFKGEFFIVLFCGIATFVIVFAGIVFISSFVNSNLGDFFGFSANEHMDIWERAEQGCVESMHSIGYSHYHGRPQDYEVAAYWYRLAAEQGNKYSQTNLGHLYRLGNGVPQDYEQALYLFTLAAENGCSAGRTSMESLIRMMGVRESVDELRNAAQNGNAAAQFYLGDKYINGEIDSEFTVHHRTRGTLWKISAAKNGYAPAQYYLGRILAQGIFVNLFDENIASDDIFETLLTLSPEDDIFPLWVLPIAFFRSETPHHLIQDFEKSLYYWRLAAENGHILSQISIEIIEEHGISVLEDYDEFMNMTGKRIVAMGSSE